MDSKVMTAVLAVFALLTLASATELHCFFDDALCTQWKDNVNASHGSYNDLKFCCPPEPGQGLTLTSIPPDYDHCICKAGTAEKYAHLRQTTTPHGDGNSASSLTPQTVLAVIVLVVAVFFY